MKRTVWTFGLISGGILSAMMVITLPFSDHLERGMLIGYATMVLSSLLIYFGIRSYRDNIGGGRISFKRALAIGSLIAVVASACYTATWEVVYFNFMPDFMTKYSAAIVGKMKADGASQAEIDSKTAEMQKMEKWYKNPVLNAGVTMLEPMPVGLVFALVSAGVLSRRRKPEAEAEVALA